jgi:integrase
MGHRGLAGPDDYLFMPNIRDRAIAGHLTTKFFRQVLIALNLRKGSLGQNRTLYSLRHTAITFRLLYGKGIDLLTLAKNARTSVEMIERFYASELDPEMNVAMLHSRRTS